MPFTNRNNNSSQRAGRGLGPCGAGMSRGKGADFKQNTGYGQSARRGQGRGQGLGLRRRDGSCQRMQGQTVQNQGYGPDQHTRDLEQRIADLEAENQRLKAKANK